jgi:hypothetical protein
MRLPEAWWSGGKRVRQLIGLGLIVSIAATQAWAEETAFIGPVVPAVASGAEVSSVLPVASPQPIPTSEQGVVNPGNAPTLPVLLPEAREELVQQFPGSTEMTLSLEAAVRMALEKNLELSIERINPEIARSQTLSSRGAFD